jgi:hypothetical protein
MAEVSLLTCTTAVNVVSVLHRKLLQHSYSFEFHLVDKPEYLIQAYLLYVEQLVDVVLLLTRSTLVSMLTQLRDVGTVNAPAEIVSAPASHLLTATRPRVRTTRSDSRGPYSESD